MLATVPAATQRFRRRLLLAAFVRGAAAAAFALLLAALAALVTARVAAPGLALPSVWWLLGGAAALALAIGAVFAARYRVGDAVIAEHLERRLRTGGLLLAAADGVELEPAWQQRLQRALVGLPSALPALRWRVLLTRPLLAAGLLLATELLPQPDPAPPPAPAAVLAADELVALAEEVTALPEVPADQKEELRAAARDLQQRARAGETDLWSELDALEERLAREQQLAAVEGGDGVAGDGVAGDGAVGDGAAARSPERLAATLDRLRELGALDAALAALPEPLREQVEAAQRPDGAFAAEDLPTDAAAREQLGDALGDAAQALAQDEAAMAALAAALPDALADVDAEELAAQLGALADALRTDAPTGGADAPQLPEFTAELAKSLADDLAAAALEMAKGGALDELPTDLPPEMRDLLAELGQDLAGSIDLETLRAMLPDDLSQLRELAESMGEAAQRLAESSGGREPGGQPPGEGMSTGAQQKLAALAEQLMRGAEGLASGGQQQVGQQQVGQQRVGQQQGGTEGGDHTALRLTEEAAGGGVGARELELPTPPPIGELEGEWRPKKADKAEPEVADVRPAGPGGQGAEGAGTPTWQLRLKPRHREVVRRFFAKDKR